MNWFVARRVVLVAVLTWAAAASAVAAQLSCADAAALAERSAVLPSGLLLAIGEVESGRADAAGRVAPWPWSVQASGVDRTFATAAEAIAAVESLRAGGTQSIDIGCFQMNLLYHPEAFASVASGFDPLTNAMAAAHFLNLLHDEFGNWEAAVAAYHSRNDALGLPYRDHVYAAWRGVPADAMRDVNLTRTARPRPVAAFGVHVWGPTDSRAPSRLAAAGRLPNVIIPGDGRKLPSS